MLAELCLIGICVDVTVIAIATDVLANVEVAVVAIAVTGLDFVVNVLYSLKLLGEV